MNGNRRFKKLLEPARVGQLQTRNRILMAAMGTNFGTHDGHVTERQLAFYEERAKGGVGIIVIGVACVDLVGKLMTHQICIYDDVFMPGLTGLAEAIQRHGARAILQLQHGGRYCYPERNGGNQPVAPSAISMPGRELPRELTRDDISHLVERFAEAALRAKKAGFDGVEIHGGHGYLLAQFLSGHSNRRQDDYGGEIRNRARILVEVIEAVRQKVGDSYPVWCRIDGREFGLEDGISVEEAQAVALMIEKADVDAIHVSGYGGVTDFNFTEAPLCYPPGNLVSLAEGIRRLVSVPVIAVGRIGPELGERVLQRGDADLIGMARPLIADPELPLKLASGRLDDIKPCIYCYACIHKIFLSQSMSCAVNAEAGKESDSRLEPVQKPKKVMIVGGGPAGMEAARIAALRGHDVTLFEKTRRLGGSAVFASILTRDNEELVDYLARQTRKLGVKVRLGVEVSAELLQGMNPDVAILAVGPGLTAPQITGAEGRNVLTGPQLRQMMSGHIDSATAAKVSHVQRILLRMAGPFLQGLLRPSTLRWLTRFWMPLGKKIAIVGGDFVACELAEFLAHRGRNVFVLASRPDVAPELSIPGRWRLINNLAECGVTILTDVECREISRDGVVICDKDSETRMIEADTVVFAEGIEPNLDLFRALDGKVSQAFLAGDCKELGLIEGAIADAYHIASSI